MPISDSQKVDYLWKKIGYTATKTDTNAAKKAPNEAIASPLPLRGDKVWKDAGSIPAVMPGSSSAPVTVYPTTGPDECTVDGTATANRTWKTGLTDWISPEFGSTYQVKVYIHTAGNAGTAASGGTQVFATGSGNNDEWFFDYQSGVLHFIGTNLPNGVNFSGKSCYISGARYTGEFGVGGDLGNFTFSTNTMTTSGSNENLIVDPNGTGTLVISATNSMRPPTGTTGQRPGSPTAGDFRYNSTENKLEYYNNSAWTLLEASSSSVITSQTFTGNGSTTAFTLSTTQTTANVIVSIEGALQQPTTSYAVSGTTLTFTQAPANGDVIEVRKINTLSSNTALSLSDTDADTKIEVERTSDNDTVYVKVAGTDKITVTSTATIISGLTHNVQNISGPGAISLTETVTLLTTTGTNAYTLADGTEGQIKIISMKVDGGNATVTPDNFVNGTSILFNATNDTITLLYHSTGWVILARQNATVS